MSSLQDHECLLETKEEKVITQFISSGIFIDSRRVLRSWFMISTSHPDTLRYFKSHTACRLEELRHLSYYRNMIHPFSKFSLSWEFFMFCVLAVSYLLAAVSSNLLALRKIHGLVVLHVILEFLFVADIIKFFYTGYYDGESNRVVLNYSKVAKRYLKTYFFFDILSCSFLILYADYLLPMVDIPIHFGFTLRFFNRFRILRLGRWLNALELYRRYMGHSSYVYRGITVILTFQVLIFWAFSIHFYIQTYILLFIEGYDEDGETPPILTRFYDATLMLLLVSVAHARQKLTLEYCDVIFFTVFGFCLHLYLFAQVLQVWERYASTENRHNSLHKQFEEYVRYKELPLSLRQRIFAYFDFKYHQHYIMQSDINALVSPLLKQEILKHNTRNLIENVEFFKYLPEKILSQVVLQMKSEVFLPGDVIVSAGEAGTSMYFIQQGTVAVYSPAGKEICHLEDGAHFGEIALILSETRVATVVAITISEFYILKRSDFFSSVEPYPQFKEHIIALATQRMAEAKLAEVK